MCCIIKLKPKVTLPKDLLMTIYENNPDGYGMMIAEKEGLFFHKDVKDFDDFWKYWKNFNRDMPRAIHFRRKTHGLINQENCHPFFPNDEVGFMHNGIIQVEEQYKDMNDTYNFMMLKMKPFIDKYPDIVEDKLFYKLIEEITGTSRLLFLTRHGTFHMTNEKMWESKLGAVFSNPGAMIKRAASTTYSYSGSSNYPRHGYRHSNSSYTRDDISEGSTLDDIQEALRESNITDPMGPWADDDYGVGVTRFGSGALNRHGEVAPVPPMLRIYDDRVPYGRAAAQEDMDTLFEEANRILEEQGIIDAEDDAELNYCEDMQATHIGSTATKLSGDVGGNYIVGTGGQLEVVDTTPKVEKVAEGRFEEAGAALIGNFQASSAASEAEKLRQAVLDKRADKGLPEVDAIGSVSQAEGDNEAEYEMEEYLTPSEFADMTEQEIVDWADNNPHGAATAILILTGRV